MTLEFNSNVPIYIQVMNDIKRKIIKGHYKASDKIESVRDLALAYGANPNTIQRALSELERNGLLRSERTAGRFICDNAELIESCKKEMANEFADQYADNVQSIGLTIDDGLVLLQKKKEKGD